MLGGIFVGGKGARMQGAAKGLLRAPGGERIVERLARALREAGAEPVLVGVREEYEGLGIRALPDVTDAGPLGGLVALLEAAKDQRAIAIACDMPHVTVALLRRLVEAPDAPVVAARRGGRWEPLFARYDARVSSLARARLARGELGLQGLLDEVGAVPLALAPNEESLLDDWDTPDEAVAENPSLATATAGVVVRAFEDGAIAERADRVAVEEPLEIRSGRDPVAVTMRTPGADVDLAAGFLLGEGVIRARADVVAISSAGPHAVVVDLTDEARARLPSAERRFFTTSSCGVCGKSSIDAVRAALPERARDTQTIDAAAIRRMPSALREAQSIFDRTGGLHAAGLFRGAKLVRFAEDVGRHNAVDKVLGAELLASRLPASGHALVLSGRIAFELVQKAALAGVSFVVAVGAPTSAAVELAQAAGIVLVGFARGDRFNVYCESGRVTR
ncbi:MAG TPA: formate dehydrogenase accessory sulfurtransferase FdhD [Polyangiaceae bacterium]|jgi:FdhD protein